MKSCCAEINEMVYAYVTGELAELPDGLIEDCCFAAALATMRRLDDILVPEKSQGE